MDYSIECIEKAFQAINKTSERLVDFHPAKIGFLERRAEHSKAKTEEGFRAAIETCRMLMNECDELEYDPPEQDPLFPAPAWPLVSPSGGGENIRDRLWETALAPRARGRLLPRLVSR